MPKRSPTFKMTPPKNQRTILSIFGFCLGIFGLLFGIFWETIFNSILDKALILRPNSRIFDMWKSPPLELTFDMYLWNWTNPEDYRNPAIAPHFEELGPYRFIDRPDKVDIEWHPENASVTYKRKNEFFFDAENSKGTLEDKVTTVNLLAVAISSKSKYWSPMRRAIIDIALNVYRNDMSITKTANQLMFGGFDDVLLNFANFIPSSIIDVIVPFDKFGYCYSRNGSSQFSGVFNIFTGADDLQNLGQTNTWNYKKSTKFFPPQCSQVYGSAGEFQPPYMKDNATVNFFLPDLCRPVEMDYVGPTDVDGLPGYLYNGGKKSVDNGTLHAENACYCNGRCVPSGVMNISSCWYGAAVFMSYPHFYNADNFYLEQISGMKPQKDKHEFSLVLEPRTGLTLELGARYQVNIMIEPMSDLKMFRNVKEQFLPLFWFEERTRITPTLVTEMKIVFATVLGGQILGGLCCIIGLIMFLWHPLMQHFNRRLLHIEINDQINRAQQRQHITVKDNVLAAGGRSMGPEDSPLLERTKNSIRRLLPDMESAESDTSKEDLVVEETTSESNSVDTQRTSTGSLHSQ